MRMFLFLFVYAGSEKAIVALAGLVAYVDDLFIK